MGRLVRLAVLLLLVAPLRVAAQTADNVLVVINDDSAASVEIGEYYAAKRGVQNDHVIRIKVDTAETIQRPDYERAIEQPIGQQLLERNLEDRILFIVLTKGVPLRIAGTGGRDGTIASVDSELALLYRRLLGETLPIVGRVPNPFYLGNGDVATAPRFTRAAFDVYLVTRLDGFSVEDIRALIDRGSAPSASGQIVLDQRALAGDLGGDQWLKEAAARLKDTPVGSSVVLETTRDSATTQEPVLGYYTWGSTDPAQRGRRSGLRFAPGAIGAMFVSTDGRTFTEPPTSWQPNVGTFAGSIQSLAGDLIRDGMTGIAAHVYEPFLDGTIRPQVLFPAYASGFTLAESFYMAMPYLSWQTVVVGDPLCEPFPGRPMPEDADLAKLDPVTEMPVLFTRRRVSALGDGLLIEARKLMVKLEGELARGDTSALEALLVRMTELEPRFVEAHMKLVTYYGTKQDWPRVVERLRKVVEVDPENSSALNDLAYILATRQGQPVEALPFAERAYKLSQEPAVLDTLGWTYHLAGQDNQGLAYIERAVAGAPRNAEIVLHAATMHAAVGVKLQAREELATALRLNPALADLPEVKALQAALE